MRQSCFPVAVNAQAGDQFLWHECVLAPVAGYLFAKCKSSSAGSFDVRAMLKVFIVTQRDGWSLARLSLFQMQS